jgi:antibiotic biosynthesis monooxygenase (ABM) superfamily enzyme
MSGSAIKVAMEEGATVVITHRVPIAKQIKYEKWLNEIGPVCKASPGLLDWHLIRPIAGMSDTYTVIIRYDNQHNLKNWVESGERKRLLQKVEQVLANQEDVHINSGLDFLFNSQADKAKSPVRWKQFLVTWSAIFPMVVCIPEVVLPALHSLQVLDNPLLHTLVVTGIVVGLMVYVVMPRYTKLVRSWLYN